MEDGDGSGGDGSGDKLMAVYAYATVGNKKGAGFYLPGVGGDFDDLGWGRKCLNFVFGKVA